MSAWRRVFLMVGIGWVLAGAGCGDDDGDTMPDAGDVADGSTAADSGQDASQDSGPSLPAEIDEALCREMADEASVDESQMTECIDRVAEIVCSEASDCYCNNCLCLLAACDMNENCVGLRGCAMATGCSDEACFQANILNPACGIGLLDWGTDEEAVALLTGLANCLSEEGCSDIECPDPEAKPEPDAGSENDAG